METLTTILDPTSAPSRGLIPADARPSAPSNGGGFQAFGDDGPSFFDILDIINPLQHIPIVSTLYREITGDDIDPVPRVAGGAIFGGLIGAVSSIVNVVVDEFTGKDIGEHVLALLKEQTGLDGNGDSPTDIDGTIMLAGDVANPTEPKRTADPPVSAVSDHLAVLEWAQQEQHFMTALAMNPSVVDLAPEDGKERTVPNTEPLLADLDINPYRMSATLASAPSQTGLNISA